MKSKSRLVTFTIVGVCVVLFVVIAIGIMFLGEVNIKENARIELYYTYDGLESHTNLTQEESKTVIDLLNSKKKVKDKGQFCEGCEDIYISIHEGKNPRIFYFCCTNCPVLYYKGKVVELQEWEYDYLKSIVGKYGARLPMCEKQ
ncbi:MAG: hypothetical protein IJD68_02305 [Ruminococcus sp.]|nr:hypothetical protein [Ruminococcus sp.]